MKIGSFSIYGFAASDRDISPFLSPILDAAGQPCEEGPVLLYLRHQPAPRARGQDQEGA